VRAGEREETPMKCDRVDTQEQIMSITERLKITVEMIKIEHTLFALPFAFLGAALAARELPPQPVGFWIAKFLWITLAMVGARSAAMTFNRIADREFDAANPRTAMRALPAGLLDLRFAFAPVFRLVSFDSAFGRVDRHHRQPYACACLAFPVRDVVDSGV
jgi:heme O synthase-like polyprenyltransferase